MRLLIAGMLLMGYITAALFFVRFWHRTGDRLFGGFAVAFALLAVQRLMLALHQDGEPPLAPYLVRLAAFVVILLAIAGKNILPRRRLQ